MKIKVEFELTPKEFRDSLGLPEVSEIQSKAIAMVKSRMGKDLKGVNVPAIVEGLLSQGMTTSRQVQQLFASLLSRAEVEETPTAAKKKRE
ncbi:MAG: DUF6489 family protein [Gammaproteobacteria bacterium]|nr:DUF6489 family protein [Gammaproteobacteria bacterium]MDH3371938.1 DUF6489 family protein [Gammaproteobacteria bacterium]MDH3407733.1 DUF6489 family protein [Gammaproteobacteria bacterium]MDH3551672.1 DUF6489 family protein [Gammaproteobacteria bacterium]